MKRKIILIALSIFIFAGSAIAQHDYAQDEKVNISVYERINPAIVSIDAQLPDGVSAGTGCIVSKNGLILTGSHVVEDAQKVDVTTSSGHVYPAKVVAVLENNRDLALLKINPKLPLRTVKLGDSQEIKVGQRVLAIGNPFGFSGTLTQGIISRIDYVKKRIQTDAAINPGCSGGPLLNLAGEVIGINQSIYNPDHNISNIGIGFAIPVNDAKKFIHSAKLE